MHFKKEGYPEEGELVFCTVTNVQYNSVFVNIEEFKRQALIHISEISPGRIRNIRDYVKEGKMIVCKVIKVDPSKGHIDVSLRRVTEMQKRQKTDERKQEQKAENIVEALASQIKKPAKQIYSELSKVLLPKFDLLQYAFEEVVEKNQSLEKLGVSKEYAAKLEELVREKIKPKKVEISGTVSITSYDPNGIKVVKEALISAEKTSKQAKIRYLGSGQHSLVVESKDYKSAEKILKKCLDTLEESLKKDKSSIFKFERKEKKD